MRDPDQGREYNAANRKLIGEYTSRVADEFRRKCEGLLNANSDDDYRLTPIEGRFAVALYWRMFEALVSNEYFCMHRYQATTVSIALILDNDLMIFKVWSEFMREKGYDADFSIVVDSQHELVAGEESCRIDFLVSIVEAGVGVWDFIRREYSPAVTIAIELDGHDFHEKTKQQASHDKRRERIIVKAGFPVFRYSGSDVYTDIDAVLTETLEHLYNEFARIHPRT